MFITLRMFRNDTTETTDMVESKGESLSPDNLILCKSWICPPTKASTATIQSRFYECDACTLRAVHITFSRYNSNILEPLGPLPLIKTRQAPTATKGQTGEFPGGNRVLDLEDLSFFSSIHPFPQFGGHEPNLILVLGLFLEDPATSPLVSDVQLPAERLLEPWPLPCGSPGPQAPELKR